LPYLVVPYKRFCSGSIETLLDDESDDIVACDSRLVPKVKRWFKGAMDKFMGVIRSRRALRPEPGVDPSPSWEDYRREPGWMARLVWEVTFCGGWI
jgi:hypothetical protein